MILFIILILLLYILYIFYDITFNNEEYFEYNNIQILSKNELNNILLNDLDNYYQKFNDIDLKARHVSSINEYREKIKEVILDKNEIDENILKRITKSIEIIENKIKSIQKPWFNVKQFIDIPWKIGIVKGRIYEDGLPHTRSDCIILTTYFLDNFNDTKLIEILIHEKMHLYQKKYPNDVDLFISSNGYTKYKLIDKKDKIRVNPDIDDWIYQDKDKIQHKAVYNRDNPFTIQDITYYQKNNQTNEHPYEKMAIDISRMI